MYIYNQRLPNTPALAGWGENTIPYSDGFTGFLSEPTSRDPWHRRPMDSQPPAPPSRPARISPAEVWRKIQGPSPFRPETPEERFDRQFREMMKWHPPTRPPGRSFNQMFWQRADERLNSTMQRLQVPNWLRGRLRTAAHFAINRGAESILNQALDNTNLSREGKEAIRATVRATLKTPIP